MTTPQNSLVHSFKVDVSSEGRYCQYDIDYKKQSYAYRALKRTIDFLGALIGLSIFSPFFIVISIAIFIEDRGPIFFSQTRIGRNAKPFRMLKFRSMVVNAEELKRELLNKNEVNGKIFKMKNDPRITKVGRLIRTTSLDEIPQFINVLLGNMSLVGPRPAINYEVEEYTCEECKRVIPVKPGLTGLSQISERLNRNKLDFEDQLELDLQYIEKQSILKDIIIIFKTPFAVLIGRGA